MWRKYTRILLKVTKEDGGVYFGEFFDYDINTTVPLYTYKSINYSMIIDMIKYQIIEEMCQKLNAYQHEFILKQEIFGLNLNPILFNKVLSNKENIIKTTKNYIDILEKSRNKDNNQNNHE
jgi:hypothetical protein